MLRPEIRLLRGPDEFRACERVQKSVWGGLSVSAETMLVTQKFGGTVLGAFVQKRLAGFIYAFLARRNGQIIHWSHLMGVLPPLRGRGLGFRMKLAHRDLALRQGIGSICWTFDPLQSRNASLNLTRLGARVEEYIVDCYGRFPSLIERGLPSDRFIVNWRIAAKKVERSLRSRKLNGKISGAPRVNLTISNGRGFLVNQKVVLGHNAPQLLVEIPPDTDAMRAESLALAKRWRFQTREIFLHYLSKDYNVDSFFTENLDLARPRCFYLLRRSMS
jgi:predicted GNAT superfamily acetyltransferase